jgi:hypothetical protein
VKRWSKLTSALAVLGAASPILFAQAKPRVVVPSNMVLPLAGPTTLSAISASPSTISFTATDPDLGLVAGSPGATVSWMTSGGNKNNTWTLAVQASAGTFNGCSTVPTAAVTATCTGVSGGKNGTCIPGGVPLSTGAQPVASGKEATGAGKAYSVTLNFTLADSWSHIANSSCTLTLTYTVNAP